ncbi:response regulator receiver protein [Richelia sinica FACHB-800]|uniref:Protein PatA n=2 Tax=Richelia TaxID=98443 RepID=A0A975T768_9NOST|nr:response regulator receiver protein [Richelia sinica FACHB-800]
MGQIAWATGGDHPYRRLCRNLAQICPHININSLILNSEDKSVEYWDYRLLINLYRQEAITPNQMKSILSNIINEIFFEITQHLDQEAVFCQLSNEVIVPAPVSYTSGIPFLDQVQGLWQDWSEAGLEKISPNLAPVLRCAEQLQTQVSSLIYKNLERLLNGKYTLWDLAVKMKQSVLDITRSLLPYIHQGFVEFIQIADLPLPKINNDGNVDMKRTNLPLIACIDDSLQICKNLEQIVQGQGIRFLGIEEPVQALSILINNRPDLIFLDLIMPTISGYEICAQLRRTTLFANTPIVILTGSNGAFDRLRATVFGATEFINKPVDKHQVIEIINKFIPRVEVDKSLATYAA